MHSIYFVTILLFTFLSANIDAKAIKKGHNINHWVHSSIYAILCALFGWAMLLHQPIVLWGTYCFFTCILIRGGWYDFALNHYRGLDWWYVSRNADGTYTSANESLWDDLFAKIKLNPNDIRIIFFILSILWLFTIPYFTT